MSVFSWDINDLWILQFDWLREFWLITQEPGICQISFLYRYKTSSINFYLSPILEKKIWKNFKNFYFGRSGSISHIFGQNWIFSYNRSLSVFRFYDYLPFIIMIKKQKKTKSLLRKTLNLQTGRQTERPTERHTGRQTERPTNRRTDKPTDRQKDRQQTSVYRGLINKNWLL